MVFTHPAEEDITAEVVDKFIKLHQAELPRYQRLKKMYESQSPILEQEAKSEYKPDNRLVTNFAKYIVDSFNGFFIGIPVKVDHEDDKIDEVVDNFGRDNDIDDSVSELAKITSVYGHGFEFLYQDEESLPHVIYNSPLDMFIVYDDTIAQKPLFAVRYYYTEDGELRGQLFTIDTEYAISESDGIILSDAKPHYYGSVPVIEYVENEERLSIFEPVESLINSFDKTLSDKQNDIDYFSDAYMKLLGMELNEETIRNIKDNRIINLYGPEDVSKLVVEFMEKPNADGSQEHLLDRLERLIYQISMVANISDESFSNASSGVSLEFKLQNMRNLAITKERKFTSGMNRRYKMLFNIATFIEMSKRDEWRNLSYTFTRNMPRNISDEAETAGKLAGITSKETQLSTLSVVDNVRAELEKIKTEQEDESTSYPVNKDGDFADTGVE